MSNKKSVHIIGSGFAGLTSACYLAKLDYDVTLLEKNDQVGGRARQFKADGFTFDMGPSWYWMPEIFEEFFQDFGFSVIDFYELKRLDPSYRVFFEDEHLDIPQGEENVIAMFEKLDPGSGERLKRYIEEAKYKYDVGMAEFVEKPSYSILEFLDWRIFNSALRMNMFGNVSKAVAKVTKNPKLAQILEFPVLFLGAKPSKTPALYTMMNYADISLGTWYPMNGMHQIIEGMSQVASSLGVKIISNSEVVDCKITNRRIKSINTVDKSFTADAYIAACDYHHFEQKILPESYRKYDTQYWESRTLAPSCLLYYVGVDRKINGLLHHNLFFDTDFDHHAAQIYDEPDWPDHPLFYVCAPSKTDPSVAPEKHENLFILIPVATGMEATEESRNKYFDKVMTRLEKKLNTNIRDHIIYYRSYAHEEFVEDYNSYKGNAYGLANTLKQTAFLKPKMKNKKIDNLIYSGQLTTPGPGVPPSIISGRVAAREIHKMFE